MLPILIAIGIGAAALGGGKTIKAAVDQKEANDTNETAKIIADDATREANRSREASFKAINRLGEKKLEILNTSVNTFMNLFEKLHNVKLSESSGLNELKNFCIDKQDIKELKELNTMASSIAGGIAGGSAAGVVTALGAYGGAMTFGAASTGTAIASLSGAAATNATLAFLGGGSLAAGGLGMAGGAAVLGGLVAGPALAVMGFILGAKASANKDEAYSNLAKARKHREEMKTVQTLCNAIKERADIFTNFLNKLDPIFRTLNTALTNVIISSGTDYSKYNSDEKEIVATSLAVAKAVKTVLDTPILTEDGKLTEKSKAIIAPVDDIIETYVG